MPSANLKMKPSPASVLWPMAFPVVVFLSMEVYSAAGNMLYAHGSSMFLLLTAAFFGAIAVPWELFALVQGAVYLDKFPELRSRPNVLLLAACYLLGAVIWVLQARGGAL
jgi:hypothetical protein